MTIATELQHYNDGLLDAYDAVDAKGGTIPADKNLDNLPTAIGSISGGGGGGPLDPVEVYNQTRPADWLKMPEIGENEDNVLYLLLHIDATTTEDIPFHYGVGASGSSPYGEVVWEFGGVNSGGEFVPDSSLTYTSSTITSSQTVYSDVTLLPSNFASVTSDGKKQLVCKISTTGTLGFYSLREKLVPDSLNIYGMIVEAKGKVTPPSSSANLGEWGNSNVWPVLRYFSLQGRITIFSDAFRYCFSLTAIPQLDTSAGTNFSSMFQNCSSLTAIPQLDTSNGTSFQRMFQNCSSLTSIPQLDTSAGTNFQQMFQNCYSLTSIPQLDTSAGTSFSNMFNYCYSLTDIPQLDTSAGTNFSNMFSYCSSLTAIPQLDTSAGTNFSNMFSYCSSLTAIPQLNISNGTNFSNMFQSCYSFTAIDLRSYDFSKATSTTALMGLLNSALFGGRVVEFGDMWPSAGIATTQYILSVSAGNYTTAAYPVRVKINKTDAMLPIATNATTLFSTNQYIYVYVPDALLSTYQADAYWATLGTRLKGFSELPS